MLKKIICGICAILTVLLIFLLNGVPIFNSLSNDIEIYEHSYSSSCILLNDKNYSFFKTGEGAVVKTGIQVSDIIDYFNAEVKNWQSSNGITNYYCFTKEIKGYKKLFNTKINLHIAVKEGVIKIGTPIIFGSF